MEQAAGEVWPSPHRLQNSATPRILWKTVSTGKWRADDPVPVQPSEENRQEKLFKQLYLKNVCLIILAEIGRHVLLMSSQNRLLSRSGDNSGIVDVYLPGLVIEHSCSFFDNYRLTLVIDIPKFTQFSFIYLWTERIVVGIVKLRHERAFLSHSNWFFFHWFKGSKIESYFMTAKMFESDTSEITSVISNLVRAEITVSIVKKKFKNSIKVIYRIFTLWSVNCFIARILNNTS